METPTTAQQELQHIEFTALIRKLEAQRNEALADAAKLYSQLALAIERLRQWEETIQTGKTEQKAEQKDGG